MHRASAGVPSDVGLVERAFPGRHEHFNSRSFIIRVVAWAMKADT